MTETPRHLRVKTDLFIQQAVRVTMEDVWTAHGASTRDEACAAAIVLELKMSVHFYLDPRTASPA
jgi:hypothetical protein